MGEVTVTGIALLLSAVLGILLARARRTERDRAYARAALLRAAAADDVPVVPGARESSYRPVGMHDGMFNAPVSSSAVPARLAAAGGATLLAALLGMALLPTRAGPPTGEPASGQPRPIELVALGHTSGDAELTVHGVARNPADHRALTGVTVLAWALDGEGREVARGEAPLARVTLDPGERSPFVVKMAVAGRATRFRVRFRAEDGTLLPHVDRRADLLAARGARSSGGTPWSH